MPSPSPATLIDCVDGADHLVGGQIERRKVLRVGANFRTCHVFVFDSQGRVLLQRLAASRDRFPARWGSSVAAYLFAGERYRDAARRRMREEVGIEAPLHYVGKTRMQDERSLKFVALFTARADRASNSDPEQIDSLRFWSVEDVRKAMATRPHAFTPTFVHLFGFYRDTLIALGQPA